MIQWIGIRIESLKKEIVCFKQSGYKEGARNEILHQTKSFFLEG